MSDYVAELRRLAIHCEFGDYLDQALRDRLVCGLCNEHTQLVEADLTLAKAVSLAQGMEAADKNAKGFKGPEANIGVKGEIDVNVDIGFQSRSLTLFVVAGSGPILLGRNWMHYTQLDWSGLGVAAVHHCDTTAETLEATLAKHSSVFSDKLGLIHPFKATLQVRPAAQPKFHRPRPVPFAIRGASSTIWNPRVLLAHSDWAAPIVAVPKHDGKFRICGDYKVTINPALQVDQYPLLKPDDLFATLAGGQKLT